MTNPRTSLDEAVAALFGDKTPSDIDEQAVRRVMLRQFMNCHAVIAWELNNEMDTFHDPEADVGDTRAEAYDRADKLSKIAARFARQGGINLGSGEPPPT